ncbi:MAG: NUDIX domain-containing protein [Alphaproteobacteria bacterium]|nr:NUDIX domain-containing protein [Alphaproteobacteria bacterium]
MKTTFHTDTVKNPNITKTHFGVYGIIRQKNKILLIKKTRGPYTGMYDLPGGGQEKGETFMQTLAREIKEETDCNVVSAENERRKSVIFGDFTAASGEKGVLLHSAVLYDVKISGNPTTDGDGRDSDGCVWIDTAELTAQNATPYALIGADKPLIALSDENDNVITTHIRKTPLPQGRFIMVSAILMFNSRGNLIMQKIATHKDWGGLWTYSAAGHVDAGENYEQAAVRELKEEMNVEALPEKELTVVPIIRNGKLFARHHIFIVHSDAPITPDPYEVAEIKEIAPKELKMQIKKNPQDFFEPFVRAFYTYCQAQEI